MESKLTSYGGKIKLARPKNHNVVEKSKKSSEYREKIDEDKEEAKDQVTEEVP